MRKQQKSMLVLAIITAFMAAALFLPGLVSAGELEPVGPPNTGTMYTLEEIYNVALDTNSNVIVNGGASCESVPVGKTGQTISYGTRDDGDLMMGVAWPDPRFTDNNDGTVTDNLTGLIWLKRANYINTNGGTGDDTWGIALSFANGLSDGECNLSDGSVDGDWRLPNIKELCSLIDFGSTTLLPSGHPFLGADYGVFWSSTTSVFNTNAAWFLGIADCVLFYYSKSYTAYAWPVRSAN